MESESGERKWGAKMESENGVSSESGVDTCEQKSLPPQKLHV